MVSQTWSFFWPTALENFSSIIETPNMKSTCLLSTHLLHLTEQSHQCALLACSTVGGLLPIPLGLGVTSSLYFCLGAPAPCVPGSSPESLSLWILGQSLPSDDKGFGTLQRQGYSATCIELHLLLHVADGLGVSPCWLVLLSVGSCRNQCAVWRQWLALAVDDHIT